MTINLDNILKEILDNTVQLAKLSISEYTKDAKKDGENLLKQMKSDLERWTKLLEAGELKRDEFIWLLASQKDSLKMSALQKAGLAQIRIEQFKNSFLNMITDVVFRYIPV